MKRIFPTRPGTLNNALPKVFLFSVALLILAAGACGPPLPPSSTGVTVSASPTPVPVESSVPANGYDTAYFLRRMKDFRWLAEYHPNHRMVMRSSNSQMNDPLDADNFLGVYEEGGKSWKILVDEPGPGCLTRLFMSADLEGSLRFYFDHSATPSIDVPIKEFFGGNFSHFKQPEVFKPEISGNGCVSYFPMPFEKKLVIMTDSTSPNIKYQANLLKLPSDATVVTYTPELDEEAKKSLADVNAFLNVNGLFRNQSLLSENPEEVTLTPRSTKLVVNQQGPAAFNFFMLTIDPFDSDSLQSLRIKMYWDNTEKANVDCSFTEFFCSYSKVLSQWFSLPMGYYPKNESLPNGAFYSEFYMPFAEKAQVVFENQSDKPIKLSYVFGIDSRPIPDDFLYFYALPQKRDALTGRLYPLLNVEGKGNFVGLSLDTAAVDPIDPPRFFLEGDEYIYVDGEKKPSWVGTGYDNYLNGNVQLQYYAPYYSLQYGSQFVSREGPGMVSGYRFHMLDHVPFSSSLLLIQEIGCPIQFQGMPLDNLGATLHRWTCYWYGSTAQTTVQREEEVFYYDINQTPTFNSPVMKDMRLQVKIPPGEYMLHYAPVWDISNVASTRQVVD